MFEALSKWITTFTPLLSMGVDDLFHGYTLNLWLAAPFFIFLLLLAIMPLIAKEFWHKNELKFALIFCALVFVPMMLSFSPNIALAVSVKTFIHHYIPFVVMLCGLFTVCGGIHITVKGHISTRGNILFLALGSVLASFIGTTGASILLLRPFLTLNKGRQHKHYLVVFFIFTISNIGGCLSPIGDPPLFLGFLNGVDFFWPLNYLHNPFFMVLGAVLTVFYFFDRFYGHTSRLHPDIVEDENDTDDISKFRIYGAHNFALLLILIGTVIVSGSSFQPFPMWRECVILTLAFVSYKFTPHNVHYMNRMTFDPLKEVATVFLAIFMTLIPIEVMLHMGEAGPLHAVTALAQPYGIHDPLRYYFLTGILSSFLDNAPTYLLFFHMAGSDPIKLMGVDAPLLVAISTGAVFWGAVTYIGNAPNLMVKSMAERMNVRAPSFFGFMAWSMAILVPLLTLFGLVYFY